MFGRLLMPSELLLVPPTNIHVLNTHHLYKLFTAAFELK